MQLLTTVHIVNKLMKSLKLMKSA